MVNNTAKYYFLFFGNFSSLRV